MPTERMTTTEIPTHRVRSDSNSQPESWTCSCGAGGVETTDSYATDQAREHERAAAAPLLRAMAPEQLTEVLRRGAAGDSARVAAVELIIHHDVWLHDADFRSFIEGRWDADGQFVGYVAWRKMAMALGQVNNALRTLHQAALPYRLEEDLREWVEGKTAGQETITGSTSEEAILRVAASIVCGLPIRLADDTSSLDNRNRGLVLTAIGHLLAHGGSVPFQAAITW